MRVVIVGGGFGGLAVAQGLAGTDHEVLLIDRLNHHLFQPLLYQVASAALAPGDIAEPLRAIFRRQPNVAVRLGTVTGLDPAARTLVVGEETLSWDVLVLAAGARHAYFGHPEWERYAPGLKTLEDALQIRGRLLRAFEEAEWTDDPARRARCLTFVVVGGGPTGVEVAGSLREIATQALARDFRRIDPQQARVILLEAGARLLTAFDPALSERARLDLERLGVEVRLNTAVTGIDADGVSTAGGPIPSATVIWGAGNAASPLGRSLGTPLDRAGRVVVEPDLSVPGHPQIFVIGDQAAAVSDGQPVPAVAPAALQMGAHVARQLRPGAARAPFRYFDKGSMATIGRRYAILQAGPIKMAGFLAWVAWVFVHLMTLVGFRNRLMVFLKWTWLWVTWQRGGRLVWNER